MPADGGGFSHYTQVVWGTTTEIGCGMASGVNAEIGSVDYLVCRFLPMGNFVGQLPYGQGAAPAVAEDTGAPPADQAAGDENGCTVLISSQCTGAPPADQGAGDQGAEGGHRGRREAPRGLHPPTSCRRWRKRKLKRDKRVFFLF